jgi:hypothetical protein
MGFTRTDYYEGIIQRQIKSGRASNKSEVIHQALALLDSVSRGLGPIGASFRNREELESMIMDSGAPEPMTPERKARIYGSLRK